MRLDGCVLRRQNFPGVFLPTPPVLLFSFRRQLSLDRIDNLKPNFSFSQFQFRKFPLVRLLFEGRRPVITLLICGDWLMNNA